MTSLKIVKATINSAVEKVAARKHDRWATKMGHPNQKWDTIDESSKQTWREQVSVANVLEELEV